MNREIVVRLVTGVVAMTIVSSVSCKREGTRGAPPVDASPPSPLAPEASTSSITPETAAPPSAIPATLPAPDASAVDAPPEPGPTDSAADADAPHLASSWTDPEAVALILKSCTTELPPFDSHGVPGDIYPSPLGCTLPFMQSCEGYHPCTADGCRSSCEGTCVSCDKACVDVCSACRAQCKDDVCKKACAAETGRCKQACVTRLDHCSTADCAKEEDACNKKEALKWRAHHCSCATITPCQLPCTTSADYSGCLARCQRANPDCDIRYCYMLDPNQPGPQVFEEVDP